MFTVAQLSHPQRLTVAQLSYSPDIQCRTAEPPQDAHFGNLRHPQISIPFQKSVLHLFYVCLCLYVNDIKCSHTGHPEWMEGRKLSAGEATSFFSFSSMGSEPRGLNSSHQA